MFKPVRGTEIADTNLGDACGIPIGGIKKRERERERECKKSRIITR